MDAAQRLVECRCSKARHETPKRSRDFSAPLILSTLYLACIALALFALRPYSSQWPTRLDFSLKPFNFEPVALVEYGDRFNRALDEGSIHAANTSLAERIAINQRMRDASYHYIGNNSAILCTISRKELMAMAATGVAHYPPMKRHRGRGNYSLLLVGNSHAAQVEKDLRREWRAHYSTFDSFLMTCLPLELNYLTDWRRVAFGTSKPCDIYPAAILKLVQQTRPDVLFINFRWDNEMSPYPTPVTAPIEQDRVYVGLQSAIDSLEPHVQRRIFIGAPNLHFPFAATNHELAKRLWLNASLDSLNTDFEAHKSRTHPHRTRLRQLRCAKCVVVDWSEAFCDTHRHRTYEDIGANGACACRAYDPSSQLAYFIDEHHYSYLGCRQIRPLLRRLAETSL